MSDIRIVPHAWGRERVVEENDEYVLKILEVDPGHRLSLEYHDRQRLTLYCLYGHGTLFATDGESASEKTMMPGRWATIEPGTIHRLESGETSTCVMMQVSPAPKHDTTILEESERFYNPYDLN